MSVFLTSSLLAGCAIGNETSVANPETEKIWQDALEEREKDESPLSIMENEDGSIMENEDDVIPVFDVQGEPIEHAVDIVAVKEYGYAYDKLSEGQKQLYAEIYMILHDMSDNVEISTLDADEIEFIFNCVMVDHPEMYYVYGYTLGKYKRGEEVEKITFEGRYSMTLDERNAKDKTVKEYITDVIESAPQGDDYDKIKYVYDYLIENNDYDVNAKDNQNILSVIENGVTVCSGYAKMTQLLLNSMDIFCTIVNGTACDNSNDVSSDFAKPQLHVWNIVKCNGEYYNLDVTWGDTSISMMDSDGVIQDSTSINYDYMLVSDSELASSHNPDPIVDMPKCNSMKDNYFVHEGLYVESIDETFFAEAFEKAYSNGEYSLTLKASDDKVFDMMQEYLIDESHIFDFVKQDNVKFVPVENRRLMIFRF